MDETIQSGNDWTAGEGMALIMQHRREHAALTEQQLERDGRIWDSVLGRWVLRGEKHPAPEATR